MFSGTSSLARDFVFEAHRKGVRPVSAQPEPSSRLARYRRRDLLSSHAKRVESNAKTGRLRGPAADIAMAVVKAQLDGRRAEVRDRREEAMKKAKSMSDLKAPREAKLSEAEKEMQKLYVEKRREEIREQKNALEVERAVRDWRLRRNRAEAETMRRIESRRTPLTQASGGALRIQPTVRDAFTDPPPLSRPPSAPTTAASTTTATRKKKPRPQSAVASTRRKRLPVPVAVPRQPFMRFKNERPKSAGVTRSSGLARQPQPYAIPAGGPIGADVGGGVVGYDVGAAGSRSPGDKVAEAAERVKAAWGVRGTPSSLPTPELSGPPPRGAGAPVIIKAAPSRPVSARRQAQLNEVERVAAAFAKANIPMSEEKLRRALVMTDDKPADELWSQMAPPGMTLPENPMLAEKLAMEKARKGKKGGKKKKKGTGVRRKKVAKR